MLSGMARVVVGLLTALVIVRLWSTPVFETGKTSENNVLRYAPGKAADERVSVFPEDAPVGGTGSSIRSLIEHLRPDCPDEGLSAMNRVTERAGDDRLHEQIVAASHGLDLCSYLLPQKVANPWLIWQMPSKDLPSPYLGAITRVNGPLLEELSALLIGDLHRETFEVTRAYRGPANDWDNPLGMNLAARRFGHLLLHRAWTRLDQDELVRLDFETLSRLIDFELQKPTLVNFLMTSSLLDRWYQMLALDLDDRQSEALDLNLLPSGDRMRRALRTAFYLQDRHLEQTWFHSLLKTQWTSAALVDRCEVSQALTQRFLARDMVLQGPLDQVLPGELADRTMNPKALLRDNYMGLVSLDAQMTRPQPFVARLGATLIAGDIVRLRTRLNQMGLEQSYTNVTQLVRTQNLVNPFTYELYQVDESGRLIVNARDRDIEDMLAGKLAPYAHWLELARNAA